MGDICVVVGLGVTGWSVVRFLVKHGRECVVLDTRERPPYLAQLEQCFPQLKYYSEVAELDSDGVSSQIDRVILSPGVADQRIYWSARVGAARVTSDIGLFKHYIHQPIIAITGSNGKSTVTSLVGVLLESLGYCVAVGGNLGTPVLDLLDEGTDYYVLELSSFQLELLDHLGASVATVLNVSPDHMDHYTDLTEYITAKQRVFNDCKCAVLNSNPDQQFFYQGLVLPECCYSFGQGGDVAVLGNELYYHGELILRASDLKLRGQHNLYNVAAGFAILLGLGLPINQQVVEAACSFVGLRHRMEFITNYGEVDWFNDSKGTNVGATIAAVNGLAATITGKIVLILGGVGKNANFSGLRETVLMYARGIVLFGRDADRIKCDLAIADDELPQMFAKELLDVVEQARLLAKPHDAVLFSPACASFDMFANFEQRGEQFKQMVITRLTAGL